MKIRSIVIGLLFCCYIFVGCSSKNQNEVNTLEKIDITEESEVTTFENTDSQDINSMEIVMEGEKTFDTKNSDVDKDIAEYVYIYDIMDNYSTTVTVISGIYNNTNIDISNFALEYSFLKDGNVIKTQDVYVDKTVTANGGFYGINNFLAEIPITDFDKIEITMKK